MSVQDHSLPKSIYCELDTHADTRVLGSNLTMLEGPSRKVSVQPFLDEYRPKSNIPIASCGTVWLDDLTGEQYLLVVHEGLFFGDRMKQSLLCPNQMRHSGLVVDDVPRQFSPRSSHSISIPAKKVTIPLELHGVISGFPTRRPTNEGIKTLPRIELTSSVPWEPTSTYFAKAELQADKENLSRISGVSIKHKKSNSPDRLISSIRILHKLEENAINMLNDDDELYERMVLCVNVAPDDLLGTE